MSDIWRYLGIVLVLLCGSVALTVAVWSWVQEEILPRENPDVPSVADETPVPGLEHSSATTVTASTTPVGTSIPPTASSTSTSSATDAIRLSPQQKDFAASYGFTGDAFVVTPAQVACAEKAVGAARIASLKAGEVPNFLEIVALSPCIKNE